MLLASFREGLRHNFNSPLHRRVNAADILVHPSFLKFVAETAFRPQRPGKSKIFGRDGVHDQVVAQPLDLCAHFDRQVILLKGVIAHVDLVFAYLGRGRVFEKAVAAKDPILTQAGLHMAGSAAIGVFGRGLKRAIGFVGYIFPLTVTQLPVFSPKTRLFAHDKMAASSSLV